MQKLDSEIKAQGETQLKRINNMADDLVNEGHSHSDEIRHRQENANLLWRHLLSLRKGKERKVVSIGLILLNYIGGLSLLCYFFLLLEIYFVRISVYCSQNS